MKDAARRCPHCLGRGGSYRSLMWLVDYRRCPVCAGRGTITNRPALPVRPSDTP